MWQKKFYPLEIASQGLFVAEVLPVILSVANNLLSLEGRVGKAINNFPLP